MDFPKNIGLIYKSLRNHALGDKYSEVLQNCAAVTQVSVLALYRLVRRRRVYVPIAIWGTDYDFPQVTVAEKTSSVPGIPIEDIPGNVVGWIQIGNTDLVSETSKSYLEIVAKILSSEFELDWTNAALTEIVKPISLSLDEAPYIAELAAISGIASDMGYVALRKYDQHEGVMRCVGFAGPKGNLDIELDQIEISKTQNPNLFGAFLEVIRRTPPECGVYTGQDNPVIREARTLDTLHELATIAIAPLSVSGKSIGTISFALDYESGITNVQRNMLLTIANLVAASLSHYEESALLAEQNKDDFARMRALVNNELLQGLRHATKNALEVASGDTKLLKTYWSKKKTGIIGPQIDQVSGAIEDAIESLIKMDVIKEIASTTVDDCKIEDVFNKAKELVMHQLRKKNITTIVHPSSAQAEVNIDGLRYAFLNLLLNSIDAFEGTMERGRKITLHVDEQEDRALITYSDNGSGLVFKPPIMKVSDIWKTGYSTKKRGTGCGLPFVRTVIQDQHGGTIEVLDHRRGMSFKIVLFKKIPSRLKVFGKET